MPSEKTDLPETVGATGVRVKTTLDAKTGQVVAPSIAVAAVTVNYCGLGQTTRTMFDASWIRNAPASFGLNQVIPGWTEGIPGMKPGGRRLLIIPGALAYGPNPPTSAILPNETLIFVVDLISSAK